MEKTIMIQRKIIIILGSLVALLSCWLGYWTVFERKYFEGTISELNKGASIDYAYINKMNEAGQALSQNFDSCNTYLTNDLKNGLTNTELKEITTTYIDKMQSSEKILDELIEMKKNRSEEFAKFQYAKVYKPEWE